MPLSGCQKPREPEVTAKQLFDLQTRVGALETENIKLKDEIHLANKMIGEVLTANVRTSKSISGLSDQVNHNAKVGNANTARDMTRRGDPGQEYVPSGNGGYVLANKQCTVNDLKP